MIIKVFRVIVQDKIGWYYSIFNFILRLNWRRNYYPYSYLIADQIGRKLEPGETSEGKRSINNVNWSSQEIF